MSERKSIEAVAVRVLQSVVTQPATPMSMDIARVAASLITTCPKCGAEAWCNIDCDLCSVCSALEPE